MAKDEQIDSIVREVCNWISILEEFLDIHLSLLQVDWVSALSLAMPVRHKESLSWIPPPLEVLKLNFDGTSKRNPT